MLVLIPVCLKDSAIAMKNLAWLTHLKQTPKFDAIIACEREFDTAGIIAAASPLFTSVTVFRYDKWGGEQTWPTPQNHAWQNVARHVSTLGKSWFWWEADATPLTADWLEQIHAAFIAGGKPFAGHVLTNEGHTYMAGVGVYPARVNIYCTSAFICRSAAFDIMLGQETTSVTAKLNHLIHHLPTPISFYDKHHADMMIPNGAVLFHKCKDGTLIDALSGKKRSDVGIPHIQVAPIKAVWNLADHTLEPLEIIDNYPEPVKLSGPRIIHCVERHKQKNEDNFRRVSFAVKSWLTLYATGLVVPAHYWKYKRSSTAIGDGRGLPYLKDVLEFGMERSKHGQDIIMMTNDDTVLHPEAGNALMEFMKNTPVACSGRVNYEFNMGPDFTRNHPDSLYKKDIGRDLFAFRKDFLEKHFHSIPDFILGELEWDLVLSAFVRKRVGGKNTTVKNRVKRESSVEMKMGYVFHENHEKRWQHPDNISSAAKKHNVKLMAEWFGGESMNEMITLMPGDLK